MICRKPVIVFLIAVQIVIIPGCTENENTTDTTFSQNSVANSSVSVPRELKDSVSQSSISSKPPATEELFLFRKNGKNGFINLKGDWVIQPKYDAAYPFVEGLAFVKLDNEPLLIDKRGQPIPMPDGVTDISAFKGGLAAVTIDGKTGFINRLGKLVLKPILDFPANEIALPSEGMRMVVVDSLFTFVDSTGKIIRQPGFEYALDFFEGRALVSNRGRYGYINRGGTLVIPMKYDVGWSFSEGLALVGTADRKDIKLSLIDTSGNIIFDVPYKLLNPRFTGGMTFFGIEKDGTRKYGFIDQTGRVVIEPVYDMVEEVVSSNSKDFGKVLAYKVKRGEFWGLVSGKIRVEPAFSNISPFHEGMAVASSDTGANQKFGYINSRGMWVITPEYDGANDFSHGLAAVRKGPLIGGNWGYVNAKGEMIIEPQFRYAYNFLGNIAMVQKDNKKAIIDKTGKVLIEE